jgi:Fe-S-cluster containining protein
LSFLFGDRHVSDSGCPGNCCEAFTIGPPELLEARLSHLDEEEAATIRDMVVYLGNFNKNPACETRSCTKEPLEKDPAGFSGHFYTCRHFNKWTRRCGIYEKRPEMCRVFPNRGECEFVGCSVRAKEPEPLLRAELGGEVSIPTEVLERLQKLLDEDDFDGAGELLDNLEDE